MIVIGLVGKMRVGKDTVCQMMMNYAKLYHPVRVAFADALKEECAQATGYTIEQMETEKDRFRGLYQWWGTEFRRNENTDYWIMKALSKITRLPAIHQMVIVTDVRFKNEASIIKQSGGTLVNVIRDTEFVNAFHASETEQDKIQCDYTIENNSTLHALSNRCRDLLFQILGNKIKQKAA